MSGRMGAPLTPTTHSDSCSKKKFVLETFNLLVTFLTNHLVV